MVQLIRDVSQALFSAPYRLEILLTVLAVTDTTFTSGGVHAALLSRLGDDVEEMPDASTISRTLKALRDAALIEPAGKGGQYRRVDSKFWTLIGEYSVELERRFGPRTLGIADSPS